MADLRPIDQVLAFEDRNTGEKLKGAAHQIIAAVCFADAGVRVEAFDDRIRKLHAYTSFVDFDPKKV
ncbi:hypothetical protein D3C73_1566090 [compost metagenome]